MVPFTYRCICVNQRYTLCKAHTSKIMCTHNSDIHNNNIAGNNPNAHHHKIDKDIWVKVFNKILFVSEKKWIVKTYIMWTHLTHISSIYISFKIGSTKEYMGWHAKIVQPQRWARDWWVGVQEKCCGGRVQVRGFRKFTGTCVYVCMFWTKTWVHEYFLYHYSLFLNIYFITSLERWLWV